MEIEEESKAYENVDSNSKYIILIANLIKNYYNLTLLST